MSSSMRVLGRVLLAVVAAAAFSASIARAQTFTNAGAISIPGSGADGRATPYGSTINVAGVVAPINYMTVTLNGYSHAYTDDVSVMLVGPGGQSIVLMAGAGTGDTVSGLTLTFAPDAGATLPNASAPTSGTWLPTVFNGIAFPAPAPAPTTTEMTSFKGATANGVWTLYVYDIFANADGGSIAGGWSITFNAPGPVQGIGTKFTYQGRLNDGAAPFSGLADLRFSLWDTSISGNPANQVGSPMFVTGVPVSNGLFKSELDFGSAIFADRALWLQVEVAIPTGSTFVPVLPRQRLTMAPLAGNAVRLGGRSLFDLAQLDQPNTFTEPQSINPFGSAVGLTIRGSASQGTTALQRWMDNTGTLLAYVGSAGEIRTNSTATASDFRLTTLVTRRKIIASHSFQPYDSSVPYNTSFVLTSSTTAFAGFVAPVDLPMGCTITRVVFYVRDNHATQDVNVSATLYTPSSNVQSALGNATSSGSTVPGIVTSLAPFTGSTVLGDAQVLLLQTNWNPSISGTACGIYGARVEYTIDNVKP